ncbi:ligand-gated channel protein [Pseudoalteromonas sp. 13-15]|uniref:TonB-dependent receptor plug domain-containing protein n=1 Tax=Pseudoalteromonas TaxID=53246 RepID=UPI0007303E69|nr:MULTISPECIES: TonB-dependent receptor [Pseudoalteromonas]AUL73074.1 ligand-gated channel protein [Pseudoalteromonas sp. 13-15]SIN82750.1 iron complex outermembrane recepter protein [Pseudoalteromonas marina]
MQIRHMLDKVASLNPARKKKIKKKKQNHRGFLFASCLYTVRSNQLHLLSGLCVFAPAMFSLSVQAASQTTGQMVQFDIKAQRADKALIEFAKQTKQTVVFSYELAKEYEANSVYGFYTQLDALEALLVGTELDAVVDQNGLLSIKLKQINRNDNNMMKLSAVSAAVLPALLAVNSQGVNAAEDVAQDKIEKIAIVGSRVAGRSVEDLPVPVDILSAEALENTGQTEVGRMLQAIAPSFNFSSSSISDGTDALRPATLRGLGPDQTLVLINGKRRHQASIIHINTSVGRGTAGTDMNAIPASAIKRIEVLRDGAAAQYGSDAIAGVINIVLKDGSEGGKAAINYGEYSEGDGETVNVDFNKGFALGDNGYLNTTINYRDRAPTNRAGLHGSCQFYGCEELSDGTLLAGEPRELTADRNTFRIGDADSQQFGLTVNTGYELGDGELYGFITYSTRDNESAAFFRHNANAGGNPVLQDGDATIPLGFLPKINTTIDDISYNFGYKTEFDNDSSLDLSYTYGENSIDYTTSDTINASYANFLRYEQGLSAADIRTTIPREAYAYGMELSLQTINLDFTKNFDDYSLAMGAEMRTDEYRILAGNEYAYRDYDTNNGVSIYSGLSGGVGSENASGGTQGFGGSSPASSVDESRDVISFYLDAEAYVIEDVILSGALRYDNYKGFGDTVNFKLAGNWAITDDISLRGALSSGFRAPSMQQLYFNNISTQFVVGPNGTLVAEEVGTFRNDSTLAQSLGIPKLKEEKSQNRSLGIVYNVTDSINVTVDYYSIDIDDRIVISNRLGKGLSTSLDAALVSSGAGAGQFFLNGADTETSGIDFVATYNTEGFGGTLDFTLAANFTETEVVSLFTPSGSGLETVPVESVFSDQEISIIEEWQPEDRINLSALYQNEDWTVNLSLNRFGEYTVEDGGRQTYGAEILTDVKVNYFINENLSVNVGANNLFDVYPDKNEIGNSRTGTIVDANGNTVVSSNGVFEYSRRSAPFGFNGAYYYVGAEYRF